MSPRWLPLIGPYEVSDDGQIRHVRRGVLKPWIRPGGYPTVTPHVGGRTRQVLIHEAVLTAFVGSRPAGCQGRHLNGDPGDNRIENLAWGTPKENAADREAHGRTARGAKMPHTRLSPEIAAVIRASGERGVALAARYGVTPSAISKVRRGKNYREYVP